MERLPRVRALEVIRVLERRGFVLSRSHGSHRIYRHEETGRRVVVPYHARRIIPPGTMLNILEQARLSREEFLELLR